MRGRRHAMRATLFGLITAGSLALVACTPPANTSAQGTTTTTGGSLTSCSVSSADLTPSSTAKGTAPRVAGLTGQKITADGSSALQPFIRQAAAEFDTANGTQSTINAGGSGQGLKDAQAGAVQIGMSDVFASEKAPTAGAYDDLVDHQVAAVVFTLIVNNDLRGHVSNLTSDQVKRIYTGQVTNWSQIGGPNESITVVSRPTTSGTRATFKKYVLGGATETASTTLTQDNTGAVAAAVQQTPGAIGYVSIGFAASGQYANAVTPICIDGAKAVASDVNSGKYVFWGIEHAYTKGPATGATRALLQYVESSQAQDNDLLALSYLKLSTVAPSAIQAHTPTGSPAPENLAG